MSCVAKVAIFPSPPLGAFSGLRTGHMPRICTANRERETRKRERERERDSRKICLSAFPFSSMNEHHILHQAVANPRPLLFVSVLEHIFTGLFH